MGKVGGFCYTRDVACGVSCRVRNSLIVHLWTPHASVGARKRGFQTGGQTVTFRTVARLVPPTPPFPPPLSQSNSVIMPNNRSVRNTYLRKLNGPHWFICLFVSVREEQRNTAKLRGRGDGGRVERCCEFRYRKYLI